MQRLFSRYEKREYEEKPQGFKVYHGRRSCMDSNNLVKDPPMHSKRSVVKNIL
jgi:hypothetical protein